MTRLLTIDEVAAQIGLSRRMVYLLIAKGALAYVQIGARKRIEPAAVDELIRSNRKREAAPQTDTPPTRVRSVTPIHDWPAAARFR